MTDVGLRELRQQANDLVRRVEAEDEVTITVSGRPAAKLVPAGKGRWRTNAEIRELFAGQSDPGWQDDRDLLDATLRDPWQAE